MLDLGRRPNLQMNRATGLKKKKKKNSKSSSIESINVTWAWGVGNAQ